MTSAQSMQPGRSRLSTLAICLEGKMTHETLRGIIARMPRVVICLDIAFAGNDQLKTNIVLATKSHGIEFHTG